MNESRRSAVQTGARPAPHGTQLKLTLYVRDRCRVEKLRSCYPECEITERLLERIVDRDLAEAPIRLEVHPWLDHPFKALMSGAWKTPAVAIDGRVVHRGGVPERSWLLNEILDRLDRTERLRFLGRRLKRQPARRGMIRSTSLGYLRVSLDQPRDGPCRRLS